MASPVPPVTYVQNGHEIDYTPAAAVTAGDVVALGGFIGVATKDIAAAALGSLAITGIFDFPKATTVGTGATVGNGLWFWDATNNVATLTGAGNNPLGFSRATCLDADKTVRINLGTFVPGVNFSGSLQSGTYLATVTAHAGGTQALAFPLTAMINRISVCATQGDSVLLPASAPGLEVTIINNGAQPAQVFGAGTDTINGIATATGISHGVGQIATYFCTVAGNWTVQFGVPQQAGYVLLAASGVINPHVAHAYMITKAGVAAMTLAAPTAVTDDGIEIEISSDTANAHTITAPAGVFKNGGAAVTIATFTGTTSGGGLRLRAYNGTWKVMASTGIAFS